MSEPSAFLLSQRFSRLIGRKVSFVQTFSTAGQKMRQLYGIYTVHPFKTAMVVTADIPLLGSFAGALVGLPDSAVPEHFRVSPMEELMRDAITEVLNIAAGAITTDGRAVFIRMATDPAYIDGPAYKVVNTPAHKHIYNVVVEGYRGGRFVVLS
jgi:hypothetical protein